MPHIQPVLWAVAIVAGCASLSALLILILRPILIRYLLAHPNARSSHQTPTPQGAGLAVMASVFAGCAVGILVWAPGEEPKIYGVLLAAAGLTLLGAIDDSRSLGSYVPNVRSRPGFHSTPIVCRTGCSGCCRAICACFPESCPRGPRIRCWSSA